MYHAFRALGSRAGSVAWLPSFHCGLEVEAARAAGFAPRFYRIKSDLSIDLSDLDAGVRAEPGPVLLIHYFGHGQPATSEIATLCADARVVLIEDCCHALFSKRRNRSLGTFGQIATFSLPKVLGTMDGGVLAMDTEGLHALLGRAPTVPQFAARARWPLLALLDRKSPLRSWTHPATWASGPDRPALPLTGKSEPRDYTRRGSRISSWLATHAQPESIVQQRRVNFEYLAASLSAVPGYSNPLPLADPGTSPLGVTLIVQNRQLLVKDLASRGIESYVFGQWPHPAMDDGAFPEARLLRARLICLPVHQALGKTDLSHLSNVLAERLPQHGTSD